MRRYPIFGLLFFGLLQACSNDIKLVNKVTSPSDALQEEGSDLVLNYTTKGKIKARLTTPKAIHYLDKKFTEMPKGAHVEFYDDSLHKNSELWADYGKIVDQSNQLTARNNVRVINTKGEKLESEELIWDDKTQKIYTTKFVKITTAKEIIYGDGLEANRDLSVYKIKKIKGTIHLKHEDVD